MKPIRGIVLCFGIVSLSFACKSSSSSLQTDQGAAGPTEERCRKFDKAYQEGLAGISHTGSTMNRESGGSRPQLPIWSSTPTAITRKTPFRLTQDVQTRIDIA
jgi:hypothetical protein